MFFVSLAYNASDQPLDASNPFSPIDFHRDSQGGKHTQELSFCIVVPDSARKGHWETRNSYEKIQRSRDSPCTWSDNWYNCIYIFEYSIRFPKLHDKYCTVHLSGQRPLQKHWVWKLVKVGFVTDFFILLVNFRCEPGTRPEAPPDPKVNTAICLDELLHLPMFYQTYWWTWIFLEGTTGLWTSYDGFCPVCNTGGVRKYFCQQKIDLKIGSGSLLRGLSSLQHCRWCRRLAFPSGGLWEIAKLELWNWCLAAHMAEVTGTGSVESTGAWDFEPFIHWPALLTYSDVNVVYYLMLGLMNMVECRRLSPLKAVAKGWVAGIDNCLEPENSGHFHAVAGNVEMRSSAFKRVLFSDS